MSHMTYQEKTTYLTYDNLKWSRSLAYLLEVEYLENGEMKRVFSNKLQSRISPLQKAKRFDFS